MPVINLITLQDGLTLNSTTVALPAKTRLNISLAVCAVAIAGIFISDRLEETMPPPPKTSPNFPKSP
jgi:hypothetical protein